MTAAVLTSTGSFAQESVAQDSARVGALLYRARTTLTYPLEYGRQSKDVLGDLTTTITITNTGSTRSTVSLKKCPIEVKSYLNAELREVQRMVTAFPSAIGCLRRSEPISVRPGESRELSAITRKWKHGFNGVFLGPLHFVAVLHIGDTAITFRSGKSALTSDLTALEYRATSTVEGVAPGLLVTRVTAFNRGQQPVDLFYGDCPVILTAFPSGSKTKRATWWATRSGPPWVNKTHEDLICTLTGHLFHLAPGHAKEFSRSTPTYEIIADSLPEDRYSFTAFLTLNRTQVTVDAGTATIIRKQMPVPDTRTIDGIRFSASVRRIQFTDSSPDSLEFAVTVHNTTNTTRHLWQQGPSSCANVVGYASAARRDSYYMRPAYEDRDGFLRRCLLAVPSMTLGPGESRTAVGRSAAPGAQRYYLIAFELYDEDNLAARDAIEVDISADERPGKSAHGVVLKE
jgi:hypothetical protein